MNMQVISVARAGMFSSWELIHTKTSALTMSCGAVIFNVQNSFQEGLLTLVSKYSSCFIGKGPFTNSPFFQNFNILNPKITERQTYFCTGNVESWVLSFTKNFFLKANQQGLLASWPVMPLTNSKDYIITAVIIHTSQITDYTASTKEKSIWIWPWIQTWQWSQDCRSVHFCWDLFQYPKHRKTCSCQ